MLGFCLARFLGMQSQLLLGLCVQWPCHIQQMLFDSRRPLSPVLIFPPPFKQWALSVEWRTCWRWLAGSRPPECLIIQIWDVMGKPQMTRDYWRENKESLDRRFCIFLLISRLLIIPGVSGAVLRSCRPQFCVDCVSVLTRKGFRSNPVNNVSVFTWPLWTWYVHRLKLLFKSYSCGKIKVLIKIIGS